MLLPSLTYVKAPNYSSINIWMQNVFIVCYQRNKISIPCTARWEQRTPEYRFLWKYGSEHHNNECKLWRLVIWQTQQHEQTNVESCNTVHLDVKQQSIKVICHCWSKENKCWRDGNLYLKIPLLTIMKQ